MGLFCGLIISEARGVMRIKLHGYPENTRKGSDEASGLGGRGTVAYHKRLMALNYVNWIRVHTRFLIQFLYTIWCTFYRFISSQRQQDNSESGSSTSIFGYVELRNQFQQYLNGSISHASNYDCRQYPDGYRDRYTRSNCTTTSLPG
jgi:hypothetical protein